MSGVQVPTSTSELQYAIQGYNGISLTNFTTSAAGVIAAGSGVEVAGAFFRFSSDDTNDATSFSAITTGATAYLQLVPSGTAPSQIVTSSWTSTDPTWRTDYNGWYASAGSTTRYIAGCVKTGTTSYEYKFDIIPQSFTQLNQDIFFRGANSHTGNETHTGSEIFSDISVSTSLTVATAATATFNTSVIANAGVSASNVIVTTGGKYSGRIFTGSISGSPSQDTIFDTLSPYIPNTNDVMFIGGNIVSGGGATIWIHRATKSSSTTIDLLGVTGGGAQSTVTITNGSAITHVTSITF